MIKEIKNPIYKINTLCGTPQFFECDTETQLYTCVADMQLKGYMVTSVTRINPDGSTPRVAVLTDKKYQKILNDLKSHNEGAKENRCCMNCVNSSSEETEFDDVLHCSVKGWDNVPDSGYCCHWKGN